MTIDAHRAADNRGYGRHGSVDPSRSEEPERMLIMDKDHVGHVVVGGIVTPEVHLAPRALLGRFAEGKPIKAEFEYVDD